LILRQLGQVIDYSLTNCLDLEKKTPKQAIYLKYSSRFKNVIYPGKHYPKYILVYFFYIHIHCTHVYGYSTTAYSGEIQFFHYNRRFRSWEEALGKQVNNNRVIIKENRIYFRVEFTRKSVKRPFCFTVSILQVCFTYLCYIKLMLKENRLMK